MTDNAVHAAGYIAGILGDLRADADRSSLADLAYLIAMAEAHAKEIALQSRGLPRRAPRVARDQPSPRGRSMA
jgi:hypothetical protein